MHELSVVENIVRTSEAYAKEQGAGEVKLLVIRIGSETGVHAKYVRMYYADVVKGTLLENAELKIEKIPAEAFCRSCGEVYDPAATHHLCPVCGSGRYDLLHGNELTIKEIGYV